MTYNLHPLFVHFPIALLVLYSVLKIIPFQKWFPRFAWNDARRILLAVGVIGAFFALATGDTAEHLFKPNHQLVEMHSTFAALATWLYAALLLGEIAAALNVSKPARLFKIPGVAAISARLEQIFCNPLFSGIVAFIALIAIMVTGLLGGAMVYGATADPFASTLLQWLGITL